MCVQQCYSHDVHDGVMLRNDEEWEPTQWETTNVFVFLQELLCYKSDTYACAQFYDPSCVLVPLDRSFYCTPLLLRLLLRTRSRPTSASRSLFLSLSLSFSLSPMFTQIRQSADVAEALHLRPFDLTHMHHDSWLLNMLHVGRMLRRGGGNARGRGEGRRGGGSYASAGEDHRGGGGGGEVPTAAGAAVACERSGRTTARRAGAVD